MPLYAAAALLALAAVAASAQDIEAITRPSHDVTLSFTTPGLVGEILVEPGQIVAEGEALMRLDDELERERLAQLKAEADSRIKIEAGQATLDQKKVILERYERVAPQGAATELEVENARLDVLIAELSLELAEFEHAQAQYQYRQAQISVDRMTIKSPIAGRVEEVLLEEGESADRLQEAIRVVGIDPIWIDVQVPLDLARKLAPGREARIAFPGERAPVATGKVIHVRSVAHAAAQTLTVRVEVPNPDGRMAGEFVTVSVPGAEQAGREAEAARRVAAAK